MQAKTTGYYGTTKKPSLLGSYNSQSNPNPASRSHRLAHIHNQLGYAQKYLPKRNLPRVTGVTNRPSYLPLRDDQQVFPHTHHRFDEQWKSGRRSSNYELPYRSTILGMSNSVGHLQSYKHSDLCIPNNRKRTSNRMNTLLRRNPILEDPVVFRNSSLENLTQRAKRDHGLNTKISLNWKY